MSQLPIVRPILWQACIPQLLVGAFCCWVGWKWLGNARGIVLGSGVYLAYSLGSRQILARHHRRGIGLYKRGEFAAAIQAYLASYTFFDRYRWLDDYRSIFMMTPGAMAYREMALVNIAFCYAQLGNGPQAIAYYERTLQEFPGNGTAEAALRMLAAAQTIPAAAGDSRA
ncbi:tol-pal system YbgF family protein [Anatilimnocola sp. NA78]|uniref:tetratricopeptide repeat protein n=1 Tax=Anatilimnocola sp. NA78 TaxID=3415683 RepID=UPI003CE56DD7